MHQKCNYHSIWYVFVHFLFYSFLQVRIGPPNVDNATIALPGVDINDYLLDEDGNRIYFNPTDDSIAVAVGGTLPDDAILIGKILLLPFSFWTLLYVECELSRSYLHPCLCFYVYCIKQGTIGKSSVVSLL